MQDGLIKNCMSKFQIFRETTQYSQVPDLSTTACGGGSPLLTKSSIMASTENVYEAKAIYRMLSNKKFAAEKVMLAVVGETNRKLVESGVKTILSVQDTTEVEYKTNAKGLGNIGTEPALKGLLVHWAIAVTTDGIPYGLLYQEIWSRPFEGYGKKHKRKELDISEKESNKWLKCVEKQAVVLKRIYVRYRFATEKEIFLNCSRKQKMKTKSI